MSFPDESISPLMIGRNKELDQKDYLDLDRTAKQHVASLSRKRLSGRSSVERLGSYKAFESNASLTSLLSESSEQGQHQHHHAHENLLKQVSHWIKSERTRRHARKAKRKGTSKTAADKNETLRDDNEASDHQPGFRARTGSESSQGSVALDDLANILEKTLNLKPADTKRKLSHVRKLSTGLKRHSAILDQSDYFESVDQLVPNCEAILDNSKTMAYTVGEEEPVCEQTEKKARKEKEAWDKFKFEILRIAHTLKLKGWRRVSMDISDQMDVQRLSGALTNAVYVVSPPKNLPSQEESKDGVPKPKNPPPYVAGHSLEPTLLR